MSWSSPVNIIVPTAGTPWECAATDGDAYYNAAENTWHYLFQCEASDHIWKGCELQRKGPDPMGQFQQTHYNPVILNNPKDKWNTLWTAICTDPSKKCYTIAQGNKVYDAGTFRIFAYDGTYYFVSFHGFDGIHGYRGIAKTNDFVHWIEGNPSQGVPADAILTKNDQYNWREQWSSTTGPIGFGAGGILSENGYYYNVVEGSDGNLACNDSIQNWDIGIFRSNSLTNIMWEQYPFGNPIFYSSKPQINLPKCSLQYMRLFKDPMTNQIYLNFSKISADNQQSGIWIYALTPSNNLLTNGDLWKCDTEGWKSWNNSPMVVYRDTDKSSDGTCYIAFNCGINHTCKNGESIYQDVNVGNILSRNITYSAKVATEAGGPGSLSLAIFEFGSNGQLLTSHSQLVTVNASYTTVTGQATLLPNTTAVRYQLYPLTPEFSYKADEMSLSY